MRRLLLNTNLLLNATRPRSRARRLGSSWRLATIRTAFAFEHEFMDAGTGAESAAIHTTATIRITRASHAPFAFECALADVGAGAESARRPRGGLLRSGLSVLVSSLARARVRAWYGAKHAENIARRAQFAYLCVRVFERVCVCVCVWWWWWRVIKYLCA